MILEHRKEIGDKHCTGAIMMEHNNEYEEDLLSLYRFEYYVIPSLVYAYINGMVKFKSFEDLDYIKDCILSSGYSGFAFNFSDVKVKCNEIDDRCCLIAYVFPEPLCAPFAKYGAVLVKGDNKAEYYILELSIDIKTGEDKFTLGKITETGHDILSKVDGCNTVEEFVELIKEKKKIHSHIIQG